MSNRIAVMSGGREEQIGTPREIYEHPDTEFVGDFIGSLNELDVRVDELVGGFALMRLGSTGRIAVAVEDGVGVGDSVRIAVRPERVQISASMDLAPDGRSRLEGTIAEIIYLGMYVQFHVETQLGRVSSHRLADESLDSLEEGAQVILQWEADQASVLGA
jgi:ABC-type Fe3+/spermidine/putrescine transport system ATPase subunit